MSGSGKDLAEEEATEYDLPLRPADSGEDKTQPTETVEGAEQADIRELSNEARVYWARYEDLSIAHDEGRYDYCRDGCFDLLMKPNLPKLARIQTLHMVSTITKPAIAQSFLEEARSILSEMDAWSIAVQELKEETDQMLEDLKVWRGGKDSEGNFVEHGDGPSEAWFEHDKKIKDVLRQNAKQEREWLGLPKLTTVEEPSNLSEPDLPKFTHSEELSDLSESALPRLTLHPESNRLLEPMEDVGASSQLGAPSSRLTVPQGSDVEEMEGLEAETKRDE